jgi:hypothetical protein
MSDFLSNFVCGPDGTWTCVRACSHRLHTGLVHFQAGARFARGQIKSGIDIASFLDHRHAFASGD